MKTFHLAYTGDFLDTQGKPAYGEAGLAELRAAAHIDLRFIHEQAPRANDPDYWKRFYSMAVTPDQLRGLDGLAVLRPGVQRNVLEQAPDLVVIGRSGAGYDKIDVNACTDHDVALFNCPSALDHSTASTALLFLLALAKRLPEQERVAREARWEEQAAVMGSELTGRTLGIVGLGRSGRELVRLVAPFGMRLLAYSPHAEPETAAKLGVELTSLARVLQQSDFVSLHARLNESNRRLIGHAEFAQMKRTAYLVNVARGALVDQAALVDALRQRTIAGAGLDVFEVEPLPADDPLTSLPNCILTPHWSASTTDVWNSTGMSIAQGMLRVARAQVPDNVVNPEVLGRAGFQAKLARFRENGA